MRERHQIPPREVPVTSDSLRRLQLALEAQIVAAGAGGVLQFNGRTGNVTLTSSDVTDALGYTPGGGSAYGYLPISIIDLPLADPSEPLLRWELTGGMEFVDGVAEAGIGTFTPPSDLRIFKNGSANGTISFTGTTGTVSFTNLVYAPGDLFELYPPTTIDGTLDRVSITLRTT